MRDHHPELAERIAEKSKITGFRDKLIHDYDEIDPEIVWQAIIDALPTLDTSIQDLMVELDPKQIKDNQPDPLSPSFGELPTIMDEEPYVNLSGSHLSSVISLLNGTISPCGGFASNSSANLRPA